VRVEVAAAEIAGGDLEQHDLAGRAATRQGVHEDQRVVRVEQVVRQVHAPDAVVGHPYPGRQGVLRGQPPDDLGAEAVVAEEEVADPGHQHARRVHIERILR
jgi:hypothetical protein